MTRSIAFLGSFALVTLAALYAPWIGVLVGIGLAFQRNLLSPVITAAWIVAFWIPLFPIIFFMLSAVYIAFSPTSEGGVLL